MSETATVYSEALPGGDSTVRCQLVVIEGPDAGRAAHLRDAIVVVGTSKDCDLVLSDVGVSERHLQVEPANGAFIIRDLGSKNGTVYEGSVVTEAKVSMGATLRVGHTSLRVQPQPRPLEVEPSQSRKFGELVGESLVMREVFAVLELAAQSDVTVLLEGETGTGKELAARGLHDASDRRRQAFVAVDCGALPEDLLESELFGHVRGAFTGASANRDGAFVRANGGTLFLDELARVPERVQARLLRAIEERTVKPVGSDTHRQVDIRIVAASTENLEAAAAAGEFRVDLFYRLSVVRIRIPPLRKRREDIAAICGALLRRRGLALGPVVGPNLDGLFAHDWPGNVRELRNVVDRAVAMTPQLERFDQLRLWAGTGTSSDETMSIRTDLPYSEAKQLVVDGFERRYLQDALARCDGNISAASRDTGVDRKHLRTLLRKHRLI